MHSKNKILKSENTFILIFRKDNRQGQRSTKVVYLSAIRIIHTCFQKLCVFVAPVVLSNTRGVRAVFLECAADKSDRS